MSAWTTLVQAERLVQALDRDDLVVVDCRFVLDAPDAGRQAYRDAHLPGALYAHLEHNLSGAHAPGAGRHPWPDAQHFVAQLGTWGVTPQHQVVTYDDGDGAYAARLWFLLRSLGHTAVAVLDGGWTRWNALGLPVERTIRSPLASRYAARFDAARLLDPAQVQAHLNARGLLVDARAAERFRGEVEPIDRIAGHVPGAVNRPYALNLDGGRFKSQAQLAQEFQTLLGPSRARDVVAMCGSGVTACHHLLAMEYAGLHGARLFTGSWSGWIEDPARPVASAE